MVPAPEYLSLRMAAAQISPISSRCSARHGRGGGLLPDLLVAALQRAVAGAEMDGVALAVAHHLDFDVARLCRYFSI